MAGFGGRVWSGGRVSGVVSLAPPCRQFNDTRNSRDFLFLLCSHHRVIRVHYFAVVKLG